MSVSVQREKISVAMAAYNGENVIIKQLDSILAQSMLPDEIIITDDSSTDCTWEKLSDYARKYPMIKIYRNENNLGFVKNFEKALSLCSGDLILLSDQDDIWTPDHIKCLVSHIGNASVACANAEIMREDDSLTGETMKPKSFCPPQKRSENFKNLLFISYTQGATMLIRKNLLEKAMPFPKEVFHDIWLGFVALAAGDGIVYIPKVILHYRRCNQNVSSRTSERNDSLKEKCIFFLSDGHVFEEKFFRIKKYMHYARTHKDMIPSELKYELKEAYIFTKNMTQKRKGWKAFKYFVKNYNLIFGTSSYIGLPLRLLRYFLSPGNWLER